MAEMHCPILLSFDPINVNVVARHFVRLEDMPEFRLKHYL